MTIVLTFTALFNQLRHTHAERLHGIALSAHAMRRF